MNSPLQKRLNAQHVCRKRVHLSTTEEKTWISGDLQVARLVMKNATWRMQIGRTKCMAADLWCVGWLARPFATTSFTAWANLLRGLRACSRRERNARVITNGRQSRIAPPSSNALRVALIVRDMGTPHTSRRQRTDATLAFSPVGISTFVRHDTVRHRDRLQSRSLKTCCAVLVDEVEHRTLGSASAPAKMPSVPAIRAPSMVVTTMPKMPNTTTPTGFVPRFAPVPDPKPHEILRPKRGRNSRRRTKEAEFFRRYMYLRRQLKPWSDDFRRKHGRTPNLLDVHASDVPGLLDRFIEYLDALEGLRVEV